MVDSNLRVHASLMRKPHVTRLAAVGKLPSPLRGIEAERDLPERIPETPAAATGDRAAQFFTASQRKVFTATGTATIADTMRMAKSRSVPYLCSPPQTQNNRSPK